MNLLFLLNYLKTILIHNIDYELPINVDTYINEKKLKEIFEINRIYNLNFDLNKFYKFYLMIQCRFY